MNPTLAINFWGAARTVTGSRHLIEIGGRRLLLDCGLFQGRRAESEQLNRELPFKAKKLDAVVLSHAHIDHSGNLPTLVRHGFRGRVHCTPATADLLGIMLPDSAHIQEQDAKYLNKRLKHGEKAVEPLYGLKDVERLLELVTPQRYRKDFEPLPGVRCRFLDAGHILGSAIVCLTIDRDGAAPFRLVFSGDLGREDLPILRDPETVAGADALIIESTYGERYHADIRKAEERLGAVVKRTIERGGKVIIPAFSVGRSQEIVYELNELMTAGAIPAIPIYIDSPLTVKASQLFAKHRECFDEETWEIIARGDDPFGFGRMTYIKNVEGSKALNRLAEPCVIISASGMAEAGRILHHLKNSVEDPRNTILIVGFMAEHTLGRRLEEGAREVRILGGTYPVRAEVRALHAYSAHADRDDLLSFVAGMDAPPRRVFVVHGEERQALSLAAALREKGLPQVEVPAFGDRFPLD
ncbi:MAG: MBL fold metallo-hydrolase [Candidatus Krumholzibacteriota bacterium]|nr:MBL fold metallo-hydrolase [Candidatus Krumholzibacteriota bacterium]